jgi:uncharacterized protein YjbJ (UPF0337 family)
LCESAIHKQFRASNVARVVGSEKHYGLGDLIRCPEPAVGPHDAAEPRTVLRRAISATSEWAAQESNEKFCIFVDDLPKREVFRDSHWYGRSQFADGYVKVTGEGAMDENRVEGTVRKAAGKVQEGLGRLTGDAEIQAKGMANETRGSAQDQYGGGGFL